MSDIQNLFHAAGPTIPTPTGGPRRSTPGGAATAPPPASRAARWSWRWRYLSASRC
ncbi:hypothetical protein G7085_07955 [Tessaracoccus sp. HDW20]|uniref:hypothetical protein n=1 Tax=Tessaracoccus coleopterorum TaxID=2714950 RepID=UPI0018D33DA9|nr:hypothetical protein [Tessaracoccus coleopterorum]NHB84567.1 hypothetical protein [Tessaracoccus coleopterorum]